MGFKAVVPYIRKALVDRKIVFADYFKIEKMEFTNSDGDKVERPFAYCHRVEEFFELLAFLRDKNITDLCQKIGIDAGKGHLRMAATLYDAEDLLSIQSLQRTTRSDGIGSGDKKKLGGPKKAVVLASSPDVPENYGNLKIFLEKVGVHNLLFTFSGDFKVIIDTSYVKVVYLNAFMCVFLHII